MCTYWTRLRRNGKLVNVLLKNEDGVIEDVAYVTTKSGRAVGRVNSDLYPIQVIGHFENVKHLNFKGKTILNVKCQIENYLREQYIKELKEDNYEEDLLENLDYTSSPKYGIVKIKSFIESVKNFLFRFIRK